MPTSSTNYTKHPPWDFPFRKYTRALSWNYINAERRFSQRVVKVEHGTKGVLFEVRQMENVGRNKLNGRTGWDKGKSRVTLKQVTPGIYGSGLHGVRGRSLARMEGGRGELGLRFTLLCNVSRQAICTHWFSGLLQGLSGRYQKGVEICPTFSSRTFAVTDDFTLIWTTVVWWTFLGSN